MTFGKRGKVSVLVLISLLFATIFLSSFAMAAPPLINVGGSSSINLSGILSALFGGGTGSVTELIVLKILVVFMLTLIIGPLLAFVPFLKDRKSITWVIAAVVAFLGTFYLTPGDIFGMLQSYSALAIALTSIIPFLIIIFFIWQTSEDMSPASVLTSKLVAGFFALFLIYNEFKLLFLDTGSIPHDTVVTAAWIYGLTLIATVVILIWQRAIVRMLFRQKLEAEGHATGAVIARRGQEKLYNELREMRDTLSTYSMSESTSQQGKKLLKDINALEKELGEPLTILKL